MCEIFCYNSLKSNDVTSYLEKFFANSEYHPHGWGLANLSPDYYEIAKEAKKHLTAKHWMKYYQIKFMERIFSHISAWQQLEMQTPPTATPLLKRQ